MRRLTQYLLAADWLITPERWEALCAALDVIEAGTVTHPPKVEPPQARLWWSHGEGATESIEFSLDAGGSAGDQGNRNVAVIPISGTIYPKGGNVSPVSGGANVRQITALIDRAFADPSVASIILAYDSPGGMVDGVPEAAAQLLAQRGRKPVSAIADFEMNSAAYLWGSQADEVVMSPSAKAGSVGVIAQYASQGKALDAAGVQVQTLRWPENKAEADGVQPLSEEAHAFRMGQIKAIYDQMVSQIARGRRMGDSKVRKDFGNGRSLNATESVRAGVADRIATVSELLFDHLSGNITKKKGWQASKGIGAEESVIVIASDSGGYGVATSDAPDPIPEPDPVLDPPPAEPVPEPVPEEANEAKARTLADLDARWAEIEAPLS